MRLDSPVRSVPRRFWPTGLLWLGSALLVAAGILAITLILWTNHEQAQSPGEKDLGVAALAIMFGLPMTVIVASGLICLIVGCVALVHRKIKANRHQ